MPINVGPKLSEIQQGGKTVYVVQASGTQGNLQSLQNRVSKAFQDVQAMAGGCGQVTYNLGDDKKVAFLRFKSIQSFAQTTLTCGTMYSEPDKNKQSVHKVAISGPVDKMEKVEQQLRSQDHVLPHTATKDDQDNGTWTYTLGPNEKEAKSLYTKIEASVQGIELRENPIVEREDSSWVLIDDDDVDSNEPQHSGKMQPSAFVMVEESPDTMESDFVFVMPESPKVKKSQETTPVSVVAQEKLPTKEQYTTMIQNELTGTIDRLLPQSLLASVEYNNGKDSTTISRNDYSTQEGEEMCLKSPGHSGQLALGIGASPQFAQVRQSFEERLISKLKQKEWDVTPGEPSPTEDSVKINKKDHEFSVRSHHQSQWKFQKTGVIGQAIVSCSTACNMHITLGDDVPPRPQVTSLQVRPQATIGDLPPKGFLKDYAEAYKEAYNELCR